MQGIDQTETVTMTALGDYPYLMDHLPDGSTCTTTRRILIISPQPASLHSLFMELTARCYDVMMFHHADDPIIRLLQADLILVDRTRDSNIHKGPFITVSAVPVLDIYGPDSGILDTTGEHILRWPASPESVIARMEAFASSSFASDHSAPGFSGQIVLKDLVVDLNRVAVYQAGARIDLTKTEFDLLKVLLNTGGRVLPRQEMMDLVWGDQYFGGSNTVDVHIKSLRHKLGDDPKQPRYISTVRGIGYRVAD